ncbi:MAG: ATP-binding cassette domain-containing protein [Saprospiraceae bacterium]|nr:ATP-binding cassette domain-containing protein [Saprospiraceae bacterium]
MIKTNNLEFQYPRSAPIEFPDISVEEGGQLLVLGESGCGKSTLLHILAGLLRPKKGEVWIGSQNTSKLSSAKMDAFRGKNIGLVYQRSYFIESLTLMDNLLISPYAPGKDEVAKVARELGIDRLVGKLPSQISVGEQQRATIARAVLHNPKLILADEPTSALDNRNCETVINLLKDQSQKHKAALIIVTHDERLKKHIDSHIDLQSEMSKIHAQ